jgi:hypothetical protein
MDNQHKIIKGYRDLSQEEINLMNEIKAKAEEVGELVSKLRKAHPANAIVSVVDQRWVSIGATDLQTGFMALVRAVAQPSTF